MTDLATDVVFVGPSLTRAEAVELFDGRICPPICRGDLDSLLQQDRPPRRIGIIDGAFLQDLAVTPKEVLRAIDAGVTLYGASSMGALRAAECGPYGMIGVGRIFQLYAAGIVEADDEVAITMDPGTFTPTSEPMINIRLAIAKAIVEQHISPALGLAVIATAARLYFPDRRWNQVIADLRMQGRWPSADFDALDLWVRGPCRLDQKADDARLLLQTMKQAADDG